MKILKRILLGLLALVALALITAFFVDDQLGAERSVVVNRPVNEVYRYIKLLKNQEAYSKWNSIDPAMKKTYRGTDGTVGFISAWESQNDEVGKGEQTITALKEGERMDTELHFIEPFESRAASFMTTQANGEGKTKVTWGFSGKMNYPLNLMCLFMDMNKAIGDDFETGLTNLKQQLEKNTTVSIQ